MRDRSAIRVTPRSAVTVAIEGQGGPLAYGVVANISEAGVCVWTDGAFQIGETLVLRLRFAQEPESLQAAGRIVWGERNRDEKGARRYGLQWAHTSGPQHDRLRSAINTSP
jgi:Tfp pilus assembly protein PilZ